MIAAVIDQMIRIMKSVGELGERMNKERENHILETILKKKRVTVRELAAELYASEPSIRRDLVNLEKRKLVKRIYGGAVLEEHSESLSKIPFALREMENQDAKQIVAQKASELVRDGDVIFLDASSSACAMVPYLAEKSNLTVITSGVRTLQRLGEYGICAYSTGGRLFAASQSLIGQDACATISRYNADLLFFSCRGLSENGAVTDFSIEENVVREAMMKQAKRCFLLCVSDKIGKTYLHNLCSTQDIEAVISETNEPFQVQR